MDNLKYVLTLLISFFIFACSPSTEDKGAQLTKATDLKTEKVVLNSVEELKAFFDKHNYNSESWQAGERRVPRITFEKVSEHWQKHSSDLPVATKKEVFFRLMAPLILISNENVLAEREIVKSAELSSAPLLAIAKKYSVLKKSENNLTEENRAKLLERVDIIPPSLALAQAAEESGWATSRFTLEGNAFFGQWDFSGKGMTPKQQRKELGNYGLARFDSPLASVEGYSLNINTTSAYAGFRKLRAELRVDGEPLTGLVLATTLTKYSERGQAYVDGIKEMITYNKLQEVDDCVLAGDVIYHLISGQD